MMDQALSLLLIPLGILGTGFFLKNYFIPRNAEKGTSVGYSLVASFSLGLILFSYFWFLVGYAGLLNRIALYSYFVIGLLFFLVQRKGILSCLADIPDCFRSCAKENLATRLLFYLVILLFAAALFRCGSSFIEGDSLIYHLFLPKQYVMQGRVWAVPFSEHAFWPFFAEACFLPGEIIGSITLSKLISFFVYLATGAAAGLFVYRKTQNVLPAVLTCFLITSSPVFFVHAPSTYNDLYFNYFTIVGLVFYLTLRENGEVYFSGMFFVGLMFGAALSCKYLAFYSLIAFFALVFFDFLKSAQKRQVASGFGGLLLGLLITGSLYYVRSYLQYSNPVFPFVANFFKTPFGYSLGDAESILSNQRAFQGAGRSFWDFLMLPFNITFYPTLFADDKVGYLFLPLSFFILFIFRKEYRLILFAFFYTLSWFLLAQLSRYLIPVLTVGAILIGLGFDRFIRKGGIFRGIVLWLIVVMAGLHTAWGVYHGYKEFLITPKKEFFLMVKQTNAWISDPNARVLLIGESSLYYYHFVAIREKPFRHFTRYPTLTSPKELAALLEKQNISHIILVSDIAPVPREVAFDAMPYFQRLVASGLYTVVDQSSNGDKRYQLIRPSSLV